MRGSSFSMRGSSFSIRGSSFSIRGSSFSIRGFSLFVFGVFVFETPCILGRSRKDNIQNFDKHVAYKANTRFARSILSQCLHGKMITFRPKS